MDCVVYSSVLCCTVLLVLQYVFQKKTKVRCDVIELDVIGEGGKGTRKAQGKLSEGLELEDAVGWLVALFHRAPGGSNSCERGRGPSRMAPKFEQGREGRLRDQQHPPLGEPTSRTGTVLRGGQPPRSRRAPQPSQGVFLRPGAEAAPRAHADAATQAHGTSSENDNARRRGARRLTRARTHTRSRAHAHARAKRT